MPKGFTLIELIMAITILGVLTAIGLVVFTAASKSSKDEIRARDLNSYKQALEVYYHENRYYPSSKNDLIPKYLSSVVTDPTGVDYPFQARPVNCTTALKNCTSYVICSTKEGTKSYDIPNACRSLSCTNGLDNCMGVSSND